MNSFYVDFLEPDILYVVKCNFNLLLQIKHFPFIEKRLKDFSPDVAAGLIMRCYQLCQVNVCYSPYFSNIMCILNLAHENNTKCLIFRSNYCYVLLMPPIHAVSSTFQIACSLNLQLTLIL